ncbi:hypothetical protein FOB58_000496 [Candida parapsilosis]|uniref:Uncharacterized protein n=2 Tax=Candida parapsilosis TaxID=5480 RepID=G8BDC9_CANPC|nr:uncharacterized protein CPAR2_209210 [Candida parapsilosis]KAF6054561.1 hypothetical protein FOB58_000483 [Candida parapsilosis]KAF6054574.1 hypothetical protein FOB58_000496 [Candida parapsilosis]KAF6056400.1 hypothetical protein FOB59_000912 [Candida parapsilosis]KAF6056413.1 hypothetical protein FOB59_000925 [Candida parapsilosis]KAF6059334.1 hypothetical protein FOB60_000916 [Candida parapsilosis]
MSLGNPIAFHNYSPKQTLIAGGVGFGIYAALMLRYYSKRSRVRKIFEDSDKNYEKVHIMSLPQYRENKGGKA